MRCGGCANTITKALEEAGFKDISVDLTCEPRKVSADINTESELETFKEVLKKHGYPLSSDERGLGEDALLKAKSFVSCAIGKIK